MLAAVDSNTTLLDTITQSFTEHQDGYFYPMAPGTPLVRIYVAKTSYAIERRRNARSAWMPIVTAHTSEFDPALFQRWTSTWPLVG